MTEAVSQNNSAETEKELGDLLFALVNVCRFEGVDPEIALTGTTERFIKRFSYIENELAGSGKTPYESTLEEMDALWNEAKNMKRYLKIYGSRLPRWRVTRISDSGLYA